jgi:D-alanyl-D-alanine carboxypeptidase
MKVTRKVFTFLLIIYIEIANILTLNTLAASNGTITNQAVKKDKENSVNFKWPKGPSVTAESAILMDVNTGTILLKKIPINNYIRPALLRL